MAARITHCMLSSHVYGPFDPRDVEAAFADPRPTGTARPDSAGTTALFRRELLGSYVAIGVTLLAIGGFVVEGGVRLTSLAGAADWASASELVIGRGLLGFFIFSGLVYHFTRLGYLIRFSTHRAAPGAELERVYRRARAPRVTILVPSYKEEPRVVRQTLLAATLQQYPSRRIVLLIDDPPAPGNREDAARLETARTLPRELEALFAEPCRRFERALAGYIVRRANGWVDPRQEVEGLAAALREAADWLDGLADATAVRDHTDALFVERILRAPARAHRVRASALQTRQDPARADLLLEYRRLATLFKVEITSFERKRYANLSHEPNKAMNVNAYLALMGKGFREAASRDGRVLEGTGDAQATLRVPDAEFIVVLDADSLIRAEYTLRLVHFVTRPGNERAAARLRLAAHPASALGHRRVDHPAQPGPLRRRPTLLPPHVGRAHPRAVHPERTARQHRRARARALSVHAPHSLVRLGRPRIPCLPRGVRTRPRAQRQPRIGPVPRHVAQRDAAPRQPRGRRQFDPTALHRPEDSLPADPKGRRTNGGDPLARRGAVGAVPPRLLRGAAAPRRRGVAGGSALRDLGRGARLRPACLHLLARGPRRPVRRRQTPVVAAVESHLRQIVRAAIGGRSVKSGDRTPAPVGRSLVKGVLPRRTGLPALIVCV